MPKYILTFLIHFFLCSSLADDNGISQLYMSIQHDVSFKPFILDYLLATFILSNQIQCPAMCLRILDCQLAMYNSINSSCTIHNSTSGVFLSSDGYVIYIATDRVTTTASTTETTTTITTTDTTTTITTTDTTPTSTITTTTTDTTPTSTTTTTTDTTPTPTTTTTTDTTTTSTTTIVSTCLSDSFPSFDTNLIALWRFDNDATDAQESYDGTIMGDSSFSSKGYINEDLSLSADSSSYVEASYINLTFSSFTIELWIRIESFSDSNMILVSQNDLTLRIGYNGIVCISETPPSIGTQLVVNQWYHIALVYNASLVQQQIYVNGKLDSILESELVSSTDSAFYIGALSGTSEFFNGEIDHLSITTRVKSACEILRDASLIASYSFTVPTTDSDSGPYGVTGFIGGSMDSVPGRVGDGFSASESNIYFQANGMTGLTIINGEFSFTLFVSPSSIFACVLIYLSSTSDNSDPSQARPYLGIDSFGTLVAELSPTVIVEAHVNMTANEWSHVALTYSFLNNRTSLYYNGILQTSVPGPSPMYKPPVTTPPVFVTLANPLEGQNGSVIQAEPFLGIIDEFNIWSRELNASEVYTAANPD